MKRLGFTLMELLIVLAVIVMVAAVGTPSVVHILDRSKFRDGVLSLQAELGRTRSRAMKSGAALVFQYRSGTGEYRVFPKTSSEAAFSPQDVNVVAQTLPETALFMGGATIEPDSFQNAPQNDASSREGGKIGSLTSSPAEEDRSFDSTRRSLAPSDDASDWSKPILFFPNGRTSTAVIFLQSRPEPGKQTYYSEISFRGMTGSARVSSISVYPPGSPEFPSVLSPQAFARLIGGPNAEPNRQGAAP
ncbi:MAG: prepilin-type N-terminal cleavage/methylation domain-containing protein [Thermoguttaceae bacterium]|nr:prepilin-type N-terminal cleavage/methylation domain-containing protein [Thermoguttaceae bacterium]